MIDVIIADHQDLFRVGMAEVLAVADDVCIVGQAQSPEQLLSLLRGFTPRVLVLSTSFLTAFSKDPADVEAEQDCTTRAR